jgi:hypothetical protein
MIPIPDRYLQIPLQGAQEAVAKFFRNEPRDAKPAMFEKIGPIAFAQDHEIKSAYSMIM